MKTATTQTFVLGLSAAVILGITIFSLSGTSSAQRRRGGEAAQAAPAGGAPAGPPARRPQYTLNDPVPDDVALKGAMDLHAHLDPDSFGPSYGQAERSDDIIDMAKRSIAAGMRGFNIMGEHMEQTGGLAYITRKLYPQLEVFGGVSNNLIVGQTVNPWLIIHMAEIKGGYGRFVEMPSWDSEWSYHTVRNFQTQYAPLRLKYFKQPFVATAICPDGGLFWANYPTPCANADLRPEVKQAIEIIATQKTRETNGTLILETAHESVPEDMMQVKEAMKDGVHEIVVSHPMLQKFTAPEVKQIVDLGPGKVWAEFTSQFGNPTAKPEMVQQYVDAIRAAGVEHAFVSSDTGQLGSVYQPDALYDAAVTLRKNGFSEHDIDLLLKINPARITSIRLPTVAEMGEAPPAK